MITSRFGRISVLIGLVGLAAGAALAPVAGQTVQPDPRPPPDSATAHGLDPTTPLSELSVDLWTEADGLPQNMANAIVQTPDGYLWVGLEEGLVRFDGVRFELFTPANTPALATPWIAALLADPDGTLWIGTDGGGLVRHRNGEFEAFTADHGLAHGHVQAIFRDHAGTLWVGTNGGGLQRLVEGRFETPDLQDSLSSDFVVAVEQDSSGSLWVGTVDGLNRVDPDGTTRVFRTDDGLAGNHIRSLLTSRDGSLWVGTIGDGLSRLRNGRITNYSTADGLSSDYIRALYEDPAGALWIGTNGGGISRFYDGRITSLTARDQLPGDLVLGLTGDAEGHIWMGLTGAGLTRLRESMFATVGSAEGLAVDIALAVLEDRDGSVWVGTAGGGLNHFRDGRIATFTTDDGLPHDVVTSLAQTRDGDVWVGTVAGGISRIRNGRLQSFDRSDGLPTAQVRAIAEAGGGELWLATQGSGLLRWTPGSPEVYTRGDGLPDDYVTGIIEQDDGRLWIGTRQGLARMDDGRITPVPFPADSGPARYITGLHGGEGDVLWATTRRGFARIAEGRVTLYDGTAGPHLGREIHAALDDSLGYLWLSTNDGILRLRKTDLEAFDEGRISRIPVDRYGRPDGLRTAEANGGIHPAALRREDGSLWFPTMRGVAMVDPRDVTDAGPTPVPLIERLVAGDSVFATSRPLSLPPGNRTLEFHFTAPTFVAPNELRFRYRLEGFDKEWVSAGGRRAAYYTNVPPGGYRFQVATRRGEGEWREAATAVDLTLEPHFYETPAFLLLVALAMFGLAAGLYRIRVRGLTRREQELMRVVAERERTEQALRLSEERLRLALEAGRMGTWEWHLDTDSIALSGATMEILGFDPATPDEARARLAEMTTTADFRRLTEIADDLATGDRDFGLDIPLDHGDGHRRHVEIRGRLFTGPDGTPTRVAGVVADITELMDAQEELRRREEELRQSQKMEAVGRLAGGVAHDFNNLLTAISGRTGLVLESLGDGDGHGLREDIEEVRDAAQRASNLTQQLLTFSRKQVFKPRPLDVNAVIGGVERMVRRMVREDVILETRLDPDLGIVQADPGGIEQILLNLVVNAQDAMPDGGRVLIRTRNGHAPGGSARSAAPAARPDPTHVILSVSDTGHGMTEETRQQAFEPFFTTKPIGKGTGLGLATVYGIVHQSGGQIRLESEIDRGTRVDIFFPIVPDEDPVSQRPLSPGEAAEGSETILLVEDEDAVRSLVRKILRRRGYAVLDATSGTEALEIYKRADRDVDMLISDVVMPGMSGRELAQRIRAIQPGIAVLLMSGYNEDEVLRRGVAEEGGMEFLQKPFEPDHLARRVREVLDHAPAT